MSLLKDDLSGLKSRLENIEGEFENKLKEVENKESRFKKIDEQIEELINKKDTVVKLNVGGRIYHTKVSTLLNSKDTLFGRILTKAIDSGENITELFFDRSFDQFDVILDFLRTKQFNLKGLQKSELEEIQEEAEYYGIAEISLALKDLQREVIFVNFESSGRYSTAGTHFVQDLNDKSLTKGICVQSPYFITIEFNFEHEIDKIEVGGYNGNSSLWNVGNGASAQILTSTNKNDWTNVGTLPSNLNATIQAVVLSKSRAKYIKFQHNSYLGLGYLKVFRVGSK